ncbi:MAG: TMCO4 family protein, partial [Rickettsiales bacterium]|nr:TMCO4 family protein [Rickettsiales bacterium]
MASLFNRFRNNKKDTSNQAVDEAKALNAKNDKKTPNKKPKTPGFFSKVGDRFSNFRKKWSERSTIEKVSIIGGAILGVAALAFAGGVIGVLAAGTATSLTGAVTTVGSAIGSAFSTVGTGIASASTAVGEALIGAGASTTATTAVGATVLAAGTAAVVGGTYVAQDKIRDRLDARRKQRKEELQDPLTRAEQKRQALHKKAELDYDKTLKNLQHKDLKKMKRAEFVANKS